MKGLKISYCKKKTIDYFSVSFKVINLMFTVWKKNISNCIASYFNW